MAKETVQTKGISITLACSAFGISESCYRYAPTLKEENEQITKWLISLTGTNRSWGFGLCFLYLRNVKGFVWNHKRVYRIYKEPGAQSAHQAQEEDQTGEARSAECTGFHQSGLEYGFHA